MCAKASRKALEKVWIRVAARKKISLPEDIFQQF
jgi:hypothetical protein